MYEVSIRKNPTDEMSDGVDGYFEACGEIVMLCSFLE